MKKTTLSKKTITKANKTLAVIKKLVVKMEKYEELGNKAIKHLKKTGKHNGLVEHNYNQVADSLVKDCLKLQGKYDNVPVRNLKRKGYKMNTYLGVIIACAGLFASVGKPLNGIIKDLKSIKKIEAI